MKGKKIEVRLTEIEKELVKAAIENKRTSKKITMSEYIRNLILQDLKEMGIL